ncbi:Hypothetical_protein [Hexamita inflata]|uniref:Hypothetical_protein n=1 Tax=Hexamita inflata TaxID=28002 RepID=A0AA86UFK2_9EUKA|nr:Hypothetical protein HINF_LOCUS41534 [Hexamita inflata]
MIQKLNEQWLIVQSEVIDISLYGMFGFSMIIYQNNEIQQQLHSIWNEMIISTSKIISFDNIRIQPNDCEPDLNYYDMKKAQVLVIGISHNDFTDKAKRYANPRFYNAHSRILYHYQAPESRETYDQFEIVTREYKTYQHIFIPNYTSCPNSELIEVRKQWGDSLVQELQSHSYNPNLILVCSSMDDLIYDKLLRRYFSPVIQNSFFKQAEFLFLPRQFLAQVISTSYCYFERNNPKQYFVQYYDDNADIVEFDMSLPHYPSTSKTPFRVLKRVLDPYLVSNIEIIMNYVQELQIKSFTVFEGNKKVHQMVLAKQLSLRYNVIVLVDGVELKGFEYLQFIMQKEKEFNEAIIKENETAKNKVDLNDPKIFKKEKLMAIAQAWKGVGNGKLIGDWARMLINGMTERDAWDKYEAFVAADITRKRMTGRI